MPKNSYTHIHHILPKAPQSRTRPVRMKQSFCARPHSVHKTASLSQFFNFTPIITKPVNILQFPKLYFRKVVHFQILPHSSPLSSIELRCPILLVILKNIRSPEGSIPRCGTTLPSFWELAGFVIYPCRIPPKSLWSFRSAPAAACIFGLPSHRTTICSRTNPKVLTLREFFYENNSHVFMPHP